MKAGAKPRGRKFVPLLLDSQGETVATYVERRFDTREQAIGFAWAHIREQRTEAAMRRGKAVAKAIGRVGR